MKESAIRIGRIYRGSNGAIRRVLAAMGDDAVQYLQVKKGTTGISRGKEGVTAVISLKSFAKWAEQEVRPIPRARYRSKTA